MTGAYSLAASASAYWPGKARRGSMMLPCTPCKLYQLWQLANQAPPGIQHPAPPLPTRLT